ncbi:hypothetical protein, partial [Faecalibacterium sp. An192]|uniref:hypothetical protein n=1 Tax=Faecalibacterium sp. An192 TaxID=1965581 RepID=UPI0019D0A107
VLYELLFGILSVSNTLKVPLQVFDIVQFSRSCPLSLLACDLFILPRPVRFVKHFFHLFSSDFEVLSFFRTLAEAVPPGA